MKIFSPLFLSLFIIGNLVIFTINPSLADNPGKQPKAQGRQIRVTTGIQAVQGWEQGLTRGNPNLARWHWDPIYSYKQGYGTLVPKPSSPSNWSTGSQSGKPIKSTLQYPIAPSHDLKPIHIPYSSKAMAEVQGRLAQPAKQSLPENTHNENVSGQLLNRGEPPIATYKNIPYPRNALNTTLKYSSDRTSVYGTLLNSKTKNDPNIPKVLKRDIRMSLKKINEKKYSIPTRLIYGKSPATEWDYSHHVIPPITTSSTFRLDSASRGAKGFAEFSLTPGPGSHPIYIYDRFGEPTVDMLQHALATAEEQESAVVFATGMAAVHAAVCFSLHAGSEIISHKTVYGCTYSLFTKWLPKLGIKVHFCDLTDPNSFIPLVNEKSRLLYLESPVNPNLELIDTQAVVSALHKVNSRRTESVKILSVFDNTFATPYCQRPGKHGIDIIIHSLTKGLSGFGTDMGGVVITREEFREPLILFRKDFGGTLAPTTAWHILVYGVSTLNLRVPRQQTNALKIAQFLESHPLVAKVRYPGLPSFPQYEIAQRLLRDYQDNFAPGFMIYFTLKGKDPEHSKTSGESMMNYLAQNAYAITLAVSLGQLRTLIEHPGSMTHVSYPASQQIAMGIDPGGIRLAVGIENPDDIIADLKAALEHIA